MAINREDVTRDMIMAVMVYDRETGIFTWRCSSGYGACAVIAGTPAGTLNPNGYIQIGFGGRMYKAHRLAFMCEMGTWPEGEVDHADGDKSNNRWSNLRQATRGQNMRNTGLRSNNTSGFKGVSRHKRSGKWAARLRLPNGGKYIHLGLFEDKVDAAIAYKNAAMKADPVFYRAVGV